MKVELHCHSTHSDGSHAAADVASMAARFGVQLFCLTDHDTFAGFEATRAALEPTGCAVLRGLELSCRAYDRTVHLLVYGLQTGEGLSALQALLDRIHVARQERLRLICGRLATLGIELDADALVIATHGRTPGRPDVARALVAAGVCSSPREAFARFLRDRGPADVPVERVGVAEGVALARAAGGRVSLAHPHSLGDQSLVRDLFVRHRAQGLDGIEAYYGKYTRGENIAWLRMARELELTPTGGSDFHGDMAPDVPHPGIELPAPAAEAVERWLSS